MSGISSPVMVIGGGGGGETLEQTLLLGDVTGLSSGIFFSDGDGANFASSSAISFSSTINPFGIKDVFIERQGAGVLQIGATAGGTDGVLDISGGGTATALKVGAGQSSTPAITFGDIDSGIGGTAGNQIMFWSNGIECFRALVISSTIGALWFSNDKIITFGNNTNARILWDTGQTNDAWQWSPGDTSNTILIVDNTYLGVDYGHANQSNPTLFIHANSATTTFWGALAHDATDFRITWGAGDLSLGSSGQAVRIEGMLNIGTADLAVSVGDFSAGATAGNQAFFDASAGILHITPDGTTSGFARAFIQAAGVIQLHRPNDGTVRSHVVLAQCALNGVDGDGVSITVSQPNSAGECNPSARQYWLMRAPADTATYVDLVWEQARNQADAELVEVLRIGNSVTAAGSTRLEIPGAGLMVGTIASITASAQGDIVAGDGTREMAWSSSLGTLTLVNGALIADSLGTATALKLGSGQLSTPAITFDENCGIFATGGGTRLSIAAGGSTIALFDASFVQFNKTVGIVGANLQLNGNFVAEVGALSFNAAGDGFIRALAAGVFTFGTTLSGSEGTVSAAAFGARAQTTDTATLPLVITSDDAYRLAVTNVAGADLILAPGIGRRLTEVIDYTQTTYTITLTINGSDTVLTEGTEWTNATSNSVSAGLLATAISAVSGVFAVAVAAVVHVQADVSTYSFTLAETGTGNTVTNSADGAVVIDHLGTATALKLGSGQLSTPAIMFEANSGFYTVGAQIHVAVDGQDVVTFASTFVTLNKFLNMAARIDMNTNDVIEVGTLSFNSAPNGFISASVAVAGLFEFGKTDGGSEGTLQLAALGARTQTTDTATVDLVITAMDAWSQAVTNVTGSDVRIAPGIGRRIYTITDYSVMSGDTGTTNINGAGQVTWTEGVEWTASVDNDTSATALAAYLDGLSGISAVAVAAVVHITLDVGTYSLAITEASDGATSTSGADGTVVLGPGSTGKPVITFGDANTGIIGGTNRFEIVVNGDNYFWTSSAGGGFIYLERATRLQDVALIVGSGNDAYIIGDGSTSGLVKIGKTDGGSEGTLSLAALGVRAQTTDTATLPLVITSDDAWSQAATNVAGADLVLAPGIGRRLTEVIDYTQTLYTVTVTINGSATILTEGTEWTNATSNSVSAGLLATAISAVSGVSAVAVSAVVHVQADIDTYSLILAESGTGNTVTNSADGQVIVPAGSQALPGLTGPDSTTGWQIKSSRCDMSVSGATKFFVRANDSEFRVSTVWQDSKPVLFGTSGDSRMTWDVGQTNDAWQWSPGDTSNAILIVDNTHLAVDYLHPNFSDPTMVFHKNATTTGTYLALSHGAIEGGSMASDAAATSLVITSQDAYSQAATNVVGADLILAPGIGRRLTEVIDYTQTVYTITLTINGSDTVLTEGTEWTNATSNSVSAGLLATAISAVSGVSAVAVAAVVHVQADASTYSLTLSETGTGNTVTNSVDGALVVESFTALGASAPKIQMKKLTGTTGGTEGDLTDIAHSLGDISKILSINVLITNGSSNRIPPVFTSTTEHEYDFFVDGTNVKVQLTAANSGAILSKAITVLLTYEE